MADFKLWLEFEATGIGEWDVENEFCNIGVHLPDGRRYGINVWTYKFIEIAIKKRRIIRRKPTWVILKAARPFG